MGHPKHEFETMMNDLTHCTADPDETDQVEIDRAYLASLSHPPVLDLGQALAESLAAVKTIETHCFEFAHDFLKTKAGNFERTELYFDVDGLVAKYHCSRDLRTYTVKITASK